MVYSAEIYIFAPNFSTKPTLLSKNKMELSERTQRNFFIVLWALFIIPVIAIFIVFFMIGTGQWGTIPNFEDLENPKSNLASTVLSSDGKILGKYYKENRTTNDRFKAIPVNIKTALLATEDVRFYSHSGIDLTALLRVAKGFIGAGSKSGGSTLSQQLAKNLYQLRGEDVNIRNRKLSEKLILKLQEWVTAVLLEKRYCKDEIMSMYLNTVTYGHNTYGIEAASRTFFGKKPEELSLDEAAVLVGLLQAPSRYSPKSHPEASKKRRNIVLGQVEKYQAKIKDIYKDTKSGQDFKLYSHDEFNEMKTREITLRYTAESHTDGEAPYFREFLRLFMTAQKPERGNYASWQSDVYHEDSLMWENNPLYGWCNKNKKANGENYNIYNDGLTIKTTIDSRMQAYAEEAVVMHMGKGFKAGTFNYDPLQTLFDKNELSKHKKLSIGGHKFINPFSERISDASVKQMINSAVKRSERWRVGKAAGLDSTEIIKQFFVKTPMRIFTWASPEGKDTLMMPMDSLLYYKKFVRCGMMSMEPKSGHVKAYVGGINYKHFQYDHVSLGRRQVGSTFKPFVYCGMFLNRKEITPEHMLANVEYSVDNPGGQPEVYTPRFSKSSKDGQMISLKTGLALSLNQISAWCMKSVEEETIISFVHRMGIISPIEPLPSICVGAVELKLREMVAAYCAFANKGQSTSPVFVTEIRDKNGNRVASFGTVHKEAIPEITAYKMVEMLRGVTHGGTAGRLVNPKIFGLKCDVGGKTGTTNNCADGWFMGITPQLVSGVWAGGEDPSIQFSNGELGQGSRMAMPVFGYYIKKVYEDPELSKIYRNDIQFEKPENYEEIESSENPGEVHTIDHSVDLEEYNEYQEEEY